MMLQALRFSSRCVGMFMVLMRHRALFPLAYLERTPLVLRVFCFICVGKGQNKTGQKRPGERLTNALVALGPTFIKLGQALSTRADIVGEEIASDLALLQDKLPPFAFAEVQVIMRQELGRQVDTLFAAIDPVPVAAASIAQVHRGQTADGRDVAIKILRPGIEQKMQNDLDLFFWLARLLEQHLPRSKRLRPVEVIQLFADMVKFELDLRFEAAAASQLRDNCRHDAGFVVPAVDWQRSAKRVMTMEWVEGIPIADIAAIERAGLDRAAIASNLAVAFFNMAYRDGFFHADLHPGNLFVRNDGAIIVVDFGIMGLLDPATRIYVAEILRGFLSRDYQHVADIHFQAGYVPKTQSKQAFALAIRSIGEPIVGQPVNKISVGKLLAQLFKITEDFDMQTQPQLLLLQKTTMLVEGVGAQLYPEVNLWKLAEPWIEEWAIDNIGIEAKLKRGAEHLFRALRHYVEGDEKVAATPPAALIVASKKCPWPYFVWGAIVGALVMGVWQFYI